MKSFLPNARREDLVIREMPQELLVYDLGSDKAHCLNRTVAAVWKHCDGKTTVDEAARILTGELELPID